MAKSPGKLMKKTFKKGTKKVKKGASQLSEQLFGEKGLMLKHTYDHTISLYRRGNDSKPLYTTSASGSCKISVFKLILVIACLLLGAIVICVLIKAAIDRCTRTRKDERFDRFDNCTDDPFEELPF